MRMARRLAPALPMLALLLLCLTEIFRLLVFRYQLVVAPKVFHRARAAAVGEAGQIDRGITVLVNQNGDLFHNGWTPPVSACGEQQFHLLTAFRLNHFAAAEDVAFLPRHGQRALFLVALMNAPKPGIAKTGRTIVFADDGSKAAIGAALETNVIGRRRKMLAANNDVSSLRTLIALVAEKRSAVFVNFNGIRERLKRGHERLFLR
jgi:hypothetical protein